MLAIILLIGVLNLHSIDKWCVAFKTMGSSLADLVQEIIKGNTKHQNLQNLFEVRRLYVSILENHLLTEFM